MENDLKLPFYAKATIFLIGLIAFFTILYIAQGIIIPIVFAIIIAIVLHPVVNFFIRKKINRIIAIFITLLFTFLLIAGIGVLLYSQVNTLSSTWPLLVDKFTGILNSSISNIAVYLKIDPKNIYDWITKTEGELINNSSAVIEKTLISFII